MKSNDEMRRARDSRTIPSGRSRMVLRHACCCCRREIPTNFLSKLIIMISFDINNILSCIKVFLLLSHASAWIACSRSRRKKRKWTWHKQERKRPEWRLGYLLLPPDTLSSAEVSVSLLWLFNSALFLLRRLFFLALHRLGPWWSNNDEIYLIFQSFRFLRNYRLHHWTN